MSFDDPAHPPLHCERDEGQMLEFRDMGGIQRRECLFLPCVQGLDAECGSRGGSTH